MANIVLTPPTRTSVWPIGATGLSAGQAYEMLPETAVGLTGVAVLAAGTEVNAASWTVISTGTPAAGQVLFTGTPGAPSTVLTFGSAIPGGSLVLLTYQPLGAVSAG
jgi:hypothetical protein